MDESIIKGRFSFVSLGCSKNLVDSERMLGLLAQDGYQLVPADESADLVIVNTCGFLEASRQESLAVIREMVDRKNAGEFKGVLVAGCLAERWKDRLFDEAPGVDQVVGVFGREEIARAADRVLGGMIEQRTLFRPAPVRAMDDLARLRITPRHFAYLKVSEGCDRACTFCSIPLMRGEHRSKPIDRVVTEARELAGDGVRELVLVAQDMTYYGVDIDGEPKLDQLLQALNSVDGIDWIRVLYCYPRHFTNSLVETLANSKKLIPYLDLPLQHINDRVLKRMNRRHTRAETQDIVALLRERIPGLVLRTTFIVGFPGETDTDFEELLEFTRQTRFERLGVFTYSFEPDTPSARMPDHVAEDVKNERRDRLMEAQQQIAFEFGHSLVGRKMDVMIDGPGEAPGQWVGRTYADAPDVDGLVAVTGKTLAPGDIAPCEITAADGYDLQAKALAKPRKRPPIARGGKQPTPFLVLPD